MLQVPFLVKNKAPKNLPMDVALVKDDNDVLNIYDTKDSLIIDSEDLDDVGKSEMENVSVTIETKNKNKNAATADI